MAGTDPRIEVLIWRDPDSENTVRVFLDGRDVTDTVAVDQIDPGRGYDPEEWRAETASIEDGEGDMSDLARATLVNWRVEAEDSVEKWAP